MKKRFLPYTFLCFILLSFFQIEASSSNTTTFKTSVLLEEAAPLDIIINEIMEDPNLDGGGTLGLPDVEYVELYNRSNKTIDLENFTFSDGSSKVATFPSYIMLPDTYLIIGKISTDIFDDFGNFLGLAKFPILSSEEELVLKNEIGLVIDVITYTQDWYASTKNAAGSFSLERINPNRPCDGKQNWTSSTSLLGGTPGRQNASFSNESTSLNFELINSYPINVNNIRLTFSKKIHLDALLDANISISNHQVLNITYDGNQLNQVLIELANPLVANKIESIEVKGDFVDCMGEKFENNKTYPIALPVIADANDLVINEVLFNPATGGVDFLELSNNSQNVIDLSSLLIMNRALSDVENVMVEKLFFPKEFIVFTKSPLDINTRYTVENKTALVQQNLPTFPDKVGNITIYTNDIQTTIIIDEFDYSADFHNALLNDKNGVSLERINVDLPTQDKGNWHSAAASVGYGTPTYENSQVQTNPNQEAFFTLSSTRISPDGDGFEDILQINYEADQADYFATIYIYDAQGRLVKKLAENELLASQGAFLWDGSTLDGQKANLGIYIIWINYHNTVGEAIAMKKAIIVAGKI